jgi:hypothetical protein
MMFETENSRANQPEKEKLLVVELGEVVATPGALEALEKVGVLPLRLLGRHQSGDWGDISEDDKRENELSLKEGFRLLSAYKLPNDGGKVWIITEADRSVTTVLLPEAY